jgi:nucleoside 2-deoxyribosyltransferase
MSRIYLASSWRNERQPAAVERLRAYGHQVYDFRNPWGQNTGFSWSEIDPDWQKWTASEYREALRTATAAQGYLSDMRAMEWADTCVLLLPCGRSAHLEAGWFAGRGKRLIIWTRDGEEPELMALMANAICTNLTEVLSALDGFPVI